MFTCNIARFNPFAVRALFSAGRKQHAGFTLIEMLVVVLIIGILAAVALPQYQKAIMKSRYTGLMPIAKKMADSNEIYYLEHGSYTNDPQDFQIQGQKEYPDGTLLKFGSTTENAYVLATRKKDFPNTYIIYQKYSENFPGEIHCEAEATNPQAQDVCKSFGATEGIGETLTSGYVTYVLTRTGNRAATSTRGNTSEKLALSAPVYSTIETIECPAANNPWLCMGLALDYEYEYVNGELRVSTPSTYFPSKFVYGYDENGTKIVSAVYDTNGQLRAISQPGIMSVVFDEEGNFAHIQAPQIGGFAQVGYYDNGNINYVSDTQFTIDRKYFDTNVIGNTAQVYYNNKGQAFTEGVPDISSVPKLDIDSLSWIDEWR